MTCYHIRSKSINIFTHNAEISKFYWWRIFISLSRSHTSMSDCEYPEVHTENYEFLCDLCSTTVVLQADQQIHLVHNVRCQWCIVGFDSHRLSWLCRSFPRSVLLPVVTSWRYLLSCQPLVYCSIEVTDASMRRHAEYSPWCNASYSTPSQSCIINWYLHKRRNRMKS